MDTTLIKKAVKTIFFKKETGDVLESLLAFNKTSTFYGMTNTGRLVIPHINENTNHPYRISTSKLYEYCDTIKKIVSDSTTIAGTLNKNTVNKSEVSHAYHKLVHEAKGKHALELFLEHFIPMAKEMVADALLQSQFSQYEVQEVVKSIQSFCFEVVFVQNSSERGSFLVEVLPVFQDCYIDEYFGSQVTIPIPIVFKPQNIQGLSISAERFILAKTIFFGERLEELAENNNLPPMEIDKMVIKEWSEIKEPWLIKKEKWILNFFNQLAVNYLTTIGVQNTVVAIGECSPQISDRGKLVFLN